MSALEHHRNSSFQHMSTLDRVPRRSQLCCSEARAGRMQPCILREGIVFV